MTLYDNFKILFSKQGKLGKDFSPYITNKFFSFSSQTLPMALKMNKYVFWLDKDLLTNLFLTLTPTGRQPWFKYIKKSKEEKDEILYELQKIYHWTDKDRDSHKHLVVSLMKDKSTLTKTLRMIGADAKQFKQHKINMIPEADNKEVSLNKFMG